MISKTIAVLLMILCVAHSHTQGQDPQVPDSVQGSWIVQSVVDRGKMLSPEKIKGIKFVFSGDKLSMVVPTGDKKESRFKADFRANPKTIDIIPLDGPHKDKTIPGIFELNGENLKLCLPHQPTKQRPSKFEAPDGSDLNVIVLKKQ
jgi:uncharacterized protein (TIGR03067 family)